MKNLIILVLTSLVFASCGKKISEQEFIQLITDGNISEVEKAIPMLGKDDKSEILCKTVIIACEAKKMDIAELLIDNGANVTCSDRAGQNTLTYTIFHNKPELARKIIDKDIDAAYEPDVEGTTSLQYALAYKSPEIALD